MNKLILFTAVAALFFSSCEQDANVDVPEVDPVLVVNCFIMPQDSFIRAKISLSTPVFTSDPGAGQPVTDAQVILYGNSSSVTLPYNQNTDYYEVPMSAFQIIAGNEYHLVATAPNRAQADAYTTVPLVAPVNYTCTMTDTVFSNDPWGTNGEVRFNYSFNDVASQNDFYRFVGYAVTYGQWSGDTTVHRLDWELYTDENADGATVSKGMTTPYWINTGGDSLVAYDAWLLHCNYDYYMFHRSIYNYSGDDPFSEPSMIYSNITGGLGIFAAANGKRIRLMR